MILDRSDLGIVLTGLRCLESQTKYNNPKDTKTLMRINILIDQLEDELGVDYVT